MKTVIDFSQLVVSLYTGARLGQHSDFDRQCYSMGSSRNFQWLSLLLLLSLSLVVDCRAQRGLPGQFHAWTPKNVMFSKDGRGMQLQLDRLSGKDMHDG